MSSQLKMHVPPMNLKVNYRPRDDFPSVQDCMKVAAGLMISLSVLVFIDSFLFTDRHFISAVLWPISVLFTILAVRYQIQLDFIVATILIVLINLTTTIFIAAMMEIQFNALVENKFGAHPDHQAMTALTISTLLFTILSTWFFIVTFRRG